MPRVLTIDPAASQTRLQLEMNEGRVRELEALMEETGLATKKDLINQALTLFEWAVRERRSGRIIASVDEASEKYKELLVPALEQARMRRSAKGAQ